MRSGEVFRLKWKDLDFENKTVSINDPEKHSNSRMVRISDTLIAMLKTLPQKSERVFNGCVHCMRTNFTIQRRKIAEKTKNPRFVRISFHTFRHWKATMEYHKTKDILHVMKMLGHKSITSTLLYTQIVSFEGDEYDVKVEESKERIEAYLKVGYEWVGQDNKGQVYPEEMLLGKKMHISRKRTYTSRISH